MFHVKHSPIERETNVFRRRKNRVEEPKIERTEVPGPRSLPAPTPDAPAHSPSPPVAEKPATPTDEEDRQVKRADFEKGAGRGTTGALLGKGSRFKGKLTFEGTVIIDGEFIGDIESEGHLEVGKDARVDGTVKVQSAVISGYVGGNVTTTGALELKATARITGDLDVKTLVVDRGATFDGTIRMTGSGSRGAGRMRPAGPDDLPPVVAPPKS